MNNVKSIVFDFDGTLHDTMEIYLPAFKKGVKNLQSHGYAKDYLVTRENIKSYLGEKPSYAYDQMKEDIDEDLKLQTQRLVGASMEEHMENGFGKLYTGTVDVLEKLYEKYDLYILSNAREQYLDKAVRTYGIEKYIKEAYAAETYNYEPKDKILEKIMPSMKKEVIFIGDRFHDIEGADNVGIKSIFCAYGFGEMSEGEKADYIIDDIKELLEIL